MSVLTRDNVYHIATARVNIAGSRFQSNPTDIPRKAVDFGHGGVTNLVRRPSLQATGEFGSTVERARRLLRRAGASCFVQVNRDCPHDAMFASAACARPA